MCSLRVNDITLKALADLARTGDNRDQMCEKRLVNFANDANEKNPGPFDAHSGSLKGLPSDLNHIRHYRFGKASRHRIYLSGSHKNCFYTAWYVKTFKKDDEDEEHEKAFQNKLKDALSSPGGHFLVLDDNTKKYVPIKIAPVDPPGS